MNNYYGIRESEVNYKLAIYAKEELEKYEGVKVYLTRYGDCPTIAQRAEIAKNYNADLLISMHINSGGSDSRGAAIWVTQDNTKVEYYEKSKELGDKILSQISYLGIQNNGVYTRSGKPNEWYPSGIVKDYYGIIRYAMDYNIRSILLEHCFISNNSDCQFINADEKIKRLALADVQGIVQAYQLEKKDKGTIPVKKMTIDKEELELEISSEIPEPIAYIYPVFEPQNVTNTGVDYYSSNPEIVRVWGGKLRGLKEGKATITAISRNNQRIAKIDVYVTKPEVPLKDISVKEERQNVYINETGDVIINFNPTNATDKIMYWKSSDPETVRVYNGHFRGLKEGKATITGISRAGGKIVTCDVYVRDPDKTYLESISTVKPSYTVGINEKSKIEMNFNPTDATNKILYWESSDPETVRVYNGEFRGLKEGKATITITSDDGGLKTTCDIYVKDPNKTYVENINLPFTEYEAGIDEALDIDFSYDPINSSNAEFVWESSNPEILRVWGPRFRALKEGTAYVIARTKDGMAEAKIKVNIKRYKLDGISPKQESYTVVVNEKGKIEMNFNPIKATNKILYWESSDPETVRVYNGEFRGLKEGKATITITSDDGGLKTTCDIYVKKPIKLESISPKQESYTVDINEKSKIEMNFNPTDATNKILYWESSDPETVRVYNGEFRGLKEGKATITITSDDGGLKTTCDIYVKD